MYFVGYKEVISCSSLMSDHGFSVIPVLPTACNSLVSCYLFRNRQIKEMSAFKLYSSIVHITSVNITQSFRAYRLLQQFMDSIFKGRF